jgi:DNA-binding LacI/PurR family transcriptional regulator
VHHLAGPRSWLDAQEREAGWRRALVTRGAPVPEPWTAGDGSSRTGFEFGQRIATQSEVSAVFCANDHMALGLMRALQQGGRRIPEDVSLVGFDDIPEAEFFGPPLTTVRQDFDELGRRALRVLVELIGSDAPGRAAPATPRISIEPSLMVRASAARPR